VSSGNARPKPRPKTVKFKYIFPDDYNPVYANGTYGGVTSKKEIALNFFTERQAIPRTEEYELNPNLTLSDTKITEPKDLPIIRYITGGVIFNTREAKALHAWLARVIAEADRLLAEEARVEAAQKEDSTDG